MTIVVRKAIRADCPEIRRLIQELADFENMPDGPKIDAEQLAVHGFDSENPPYICFVAEDTCQKAGSSVKLVGYAIFFIGYSTWRGKKLYLEDIMVTNSFRGQGIGKELFKQVCKEGLQLGCEVMHFAVLKWNPACKFYEKLGAFNASEKEDWQLYFLNKEFMVNITK